MRRNPDDDETPFGDPFGGIDQLVNGVKGSEMDHVDVQKYDDRVTVVADVPGVEAENVDLQCDGRNLAIRVVVDSRPVVIRIDLPAYVDDRSARMNVNNGVLEVTLDRDNDPAKIGFR